MACRERRPLSDRLEMVLRAQFGFTANPHPENQKGAELGQRLLAAQIEVGGDTGLAGLLRADLDGGR